MQKCDISELECVLTHHCNSIIYIKNSLKGKESNSDNFSIEYKPETAGKPYLGTKSALISSLDMVIISVTLSTWIRIAYLLAGFFNYIHQGSYCSYPVPS